TFVRSRGRTRPVRVVNGSISIPLPYIHKVTGNSGGGGHSRADQMGTSAPSLASLKVTVAGRGAALALGKLIAIDGNAHATSCFAPVKASLAENVCQSLFFSHTAHAHRARDNQRSYVRRHVLTL